ncbi:MAG: DUF4054 domain-containing protein [Gammaproteobacteria bacterium]|nr:DUF4054 domain-containing protein [Gammaproteobacteria bacterium]
MITVNDITLDDFKSWFVRDFQYATPIGETEPVLDCPKDFVTDNDIRKSYSEAKMLFNPSLFSTDEEFKMCFLYLSAHYLSYDLQAAAQGAGNQGAYPVNSRSVGGVSESYTIPDWMASDPVLSPLMLTRYGQKYLSLIRPLLIGAVAVYRGWTTPW